MLHSGLNILKCMYCPAYFGSKHIRGHLKSHDFPVPPAGAVEAALELCDEHKIPLENFDCPLPHPGGPPVEGRTLDFGFACLQPGCMHAVTSEKKMIDHQAKVHSGELSRFEPQCIQHLFAVPTRYFAVNASLSNDEASEEDADLSMHLIHNILPTATEARPILTATDDRGRSQIEIHFGFDQLLLAVRKSRKSLDLLADLKKRSKEGEEDGVYDKLKTAMERWHTAVCHDLNGKPNQLDLERFMIYGDRPIPCEQ